MRYQWYKNGVKYTTDTGTTINTTNAYPNSAILEGGGSIIGKAITDEYKLVIIDDYDNLHQAYSYITTTGDESLKVPSCEIKPYIIQYWVGNSNHESNFDISVSPISGEFPDSASYTFTCNNNVVLSTAPSYHIDINNEQVAGTYVCTVNTTQDSKISSPAYILNDSAIYLKVYNMDTDMPALQYDICKVTALLSNKNDKDPDDNRYITLKLTPATLPLSSHPVLDSLLVKEDINNKAFYKLQAIYKRIENNGNPIGKLGLRITTELSEDEKNSNYILKKNPVLRIYDNNNKPLKNGNTKKDVVARLSLYTTTQGATFQLSTING